MNPHHKFLLKHRVYCELCSAVIPATQVIQVRVDPRWPDNTRAAVVCDAHWRAYHPIEAGMQDRARLEAK